MTTKELINQYVTAHADNRWMDASELEALLTEFAEEMKKDAIEGGCFSYKNGYVHISCDIDEHLTDIKIGDKVKVIIIKE